MSLNSPRAHPCRKKKRTKKNIQKHLDKRVVSKEKSTSGEKSKNNKRVRVGRSRRNC